MLTLFLSLVGAGAGLVGAAAAALILAVSSCQAASGAFLSICKLCTAIHRFHHQILRREDDPGLAFSNCYIIHNIWSLNKNAKIFIDGIPGGLF